MNIQIDNIYEVFFTFVALSIILRSIFYSCKYLITRVNADKLITKKFIWNRIIQQDTDYFYFSIIWLILQIVKNFNIEGAL